MTRLSHSAADKYERCPAQYKLHYIDKIRPEKTSSALIFGSALDDVLNVLLETKMDNPPPTAIDNMERLKNGFDIKFANQMVNKEYIDIRTSHYVEYFGSDFDPDVLTDVEITSLKTFINDAGYIVDPEKESYDETNRPDPVDLYNTIAGYIKEKLTLNSTDLSFYNYASWLSLKRKGHMMLDYYKDEIMPQIKRVESIQRKVELPNDDGDEFIGYIDFEGELEGHDGIITIDNKTSSRKYKVSDINDKGQLLGYDEFTGNGKAAYIVLMKKIKYTITVKCDACGEESTRRLKNCPNKKCKGKMIEFSKVPSIESQILVDNIDEEKKDLHFDKLCGILEGIENKEFQQNRDSCFQFGRKCPYYDYCRSNPAEPDIKGLIEND